MVYEHTRNLKFERFIDALRKKLPAGWGRNVHGSRQPQVDGWIEEFFYIEEDNIGIVRPGYCVNRPPLGPEGGCATIHPFEEAELLRRWRIAKTMFKIRC